MASLAALPDAAERILTAIVTELQLRKVALPARQYRAAGQLEVWDGEQLTVALMGLHQGQPGQPVGFGQHPAAVHFTAQFRVSLVRVVTTLKEGAFAGGTIPTSQEMDADGVSLIGDAPALIEAGLAVLAKDFNTNGQTYGVAFPGELVAVDGVTPIGPQGDLAGTRLLISLPVG